MTRIRRVSVKRKKQLDEYHKIVRPNYLMVYPVCEVENCTKAATDIHHKKGRSGAVLIDTNFFLSTCREHHIYIENNPNWAKENGYSLNRT